MTESEIIKMAREAGFGSSRNCDIVVRHSDGYWVGVKAQLLMFAELVATAEREACAKLCGDYWDYLDIGEDDYQDGRGCAALDLQSAIRARNKPPKGGG